MLFSSRKSERSRLVFLLSLGLRALIFLLTSLLCMLPGPDQAASSGHARRFFCPSTKDGRRVLW